MFSVRCEFTRSNKELHYLFFKEIDALSSAIYCRTLALRRGGGFITVHSPGKKLLLVMGV